MNERNFFRVRDIPWRQLDRTQRPVLLGQDAAELRVLRVDHEGIVAAVVLRKKFVSSIFVREWT